MPMLDDATVAHFWSKIDRKGPEECWPWRGARDKDGYGIFSPIRPKRPARRSHRVAFEIAGGEIGSLFVLHSCDNPPCCNPNHLSRGTGKRNAQERSERGRCKRGKDHHKTKLLEANIPEIRRLLASGTSCDTIAEIFGVRPPAIWKIKSGRNWKWLVTPLEAHLPPKTT